MTGRWQLSGQAHTGAPAAAHAAARHCLQASKDMAQASVHTHTHTTHINRNARMALALGRVLVRSTCSTWGPARHARGHGPAAAARACSVYTDAARVRRAVSAPSACCVHLHVWMTRAAAARKRRAATHMPRHARNTRLRTHSPTRAAPAVASRAHAVPQQQKECCCHHHAVTSTCPNGQEHARWGLMLPTHTHTHRHVRCGRQRVTRGRSAGPPQGRLQNSWTSLSGPPPEPHTNGNKSRRAACCSHSKHDDDTCHAQNTLSTRWHELPLVQ